MTATQLIADLTRMGIQLEAHGERLRYSPRSRVTPVLAQSMKKHKPELLAILRHDAEAPEIDLTHPTVLWQAALDELEGDPQFPSHLMESLRFAKVELILDK